MSNFTPAWFKKGFFNESLFCDDFLSTHQLLYSNGAFFTPDGRMTDTMPVNMSGQTLPRRSPMWWMC